MARFADREGGAWVVDLNVTSLKYLKKNGFDIGKAIEGGDVIARLMDDPIFLVDMIFLLCEDQAKERNISDEDFGRLVGKGEVIDAATEAFIEELLLFYRSRGQVIRKAMEKYESLQKKMITLAEKKIEEVDEDQVIASFGKQLTSSLEFSELTQDHLPSEN